MLTSVGQVFGAQILNPAVIAAKSRNKIFFQVAFLIRTEHYNRETKVKSSGHCFLCSQRESGRFPSSKRVEEAPCMFVGWFWVWYLTA